MQRGFIILWRCVQDNHFWQDKPFDRGRAWIDLIMLANHKETCLWKRGIKIVVARGQVGWSERLLAERWGWSRGKVQRFIKDLKNEHQIEHENEPQNNNVTSLITIVNYDKFQTYEPQNEPQNEPQTGRKRAANSTREKQLNNGNNKDLKPSVEIPDWIPSDDWKEYLAMRIRIKKPLAEESYHLAFAKLEKLRGDGNDPGDVLRQSTFNSWQGLFEIKKDLVTNGAKAGPVTFQAQKTENMIGALQRSRERILANENVGSGSVSQIVN